MKQIQFECSDSVTFENKIKQIKSEYDSPLKGRLIFTIYSVFSEINDLKVYLDILDNLLPETDYYGCQASGSILKDQLCTGGIGVVCTILEDETTKSEMVFISPNQSEADYTFLDELWEHCNQLPWLKGVEILSTSKAKGFYAIGENPISLREDIQIYGAVASNAANDGFSNTYVFSKGHPASIQGVVAVLFGGEHLSIESSMVTGWEGLGKNFHVTKCSGNVIYEIDGQPAFHIYEKYLGINKTPNFMSDAMRFPILVDDSGVECIRVPQPVEGLNAIVLQTPVTNGTRIRLSYGDEKTILSSIERWSEDIQQFEPEVIRVFSCIGRRTFWGDERVCEETNPLNRIADVTGFFTFGEFLRIKGKLCYFNSTLVGVIIREGEVGGAREYPRFENSQTNRSVAGYLTHYLRAVTGEIESQYHRMSEALARTYSHMVGIDYANNRIIHLNKKENSENMFDATDGAKTIINDLIQELVNRKHQAMAKQMFNPEWLNRELKDKNSIDQELLNPAMEWIRVQMIVTARDESGNIERVIFTAQSIDNEKRREEYLLMASNTDELTQLGNRHAYEREVVRASVPEDETFALVAMDLNGLKKVNDSLGHPAGDRLIVAAADIIRDVIEPYGKAYRIGGDEFMAAISATPDRITRLMNQIRQRGLDWNEIEGQCVAISCGAASAKEFPGQAISGLEKIADERMYKDKDDYYARKGLNRRKDHSMYDQLVIESLANEYESLWLIDIASRRMMIYREDKETAIPGSVNQALELIDYELARNWYIDSYVAERDRERVRKDSSLEAVVAGIQRQKTLFVDYIRCYGDRSNYNQIVLMKANSGEEITHIMLGFRDIDSRKLIEIDDLTGLYTREAFLQRGEQLLEDNPEKVYGLLLADTVDFKSINEAYGIKTGDEILRSIGLSLQEKSASDVLIGRYGGDQFAILTSMEQIDGLTKEAEFFHRLQHPEGLPGVTIKLGLCRNIRAGKAVTVACDEAHLALNSIKHSYGKILSVYDVMIKKDLDSQRIIENTMHEALAMRQFKVYYQPKHDTTTGKMVGAEALIRWVHPQKGFMSPGEFIPLFEKNGFITETDRFVWTKTCENLRSWMDEGIEVVPVSVNASKLTVMQEDLIEKMQKPVQEYNIDPGLLHMEVTESLMSENMDLLTFKLKKVHDLGYKIELDDFGAGYSSINVLSILPIDVVKLDMSFMKQFGDPKRTKVLEACSSLAKNLGYRTVSEGVETIEQVEKLQSLEVDTIQGYYYSRPLPEEEFKQYLIENSQGA